MEILSKRMVLLDKIRDAKLLSVERIATNRWFLKCSQPFPSLINTRIEEHKNFKEKQKPQ